MPVAISCTLQSIIIYHQRTQSEMLCILTAHIRLYIYLGLEFLIRGLINQIIPFLLKLKSYVMTGLTFDSGPIFMMCSESLPFPNQKVLLIYTASELWLYKYTSCLFYKLIKLCLCSDNPLQTCNFNFQK